METKAATSNLNPHDVDPDDPFDLKKSQDVEDADGIHSTSYSSSDYEMSDAGNFCPNSESDSDVEIPFQEILQCYKPPELEKQQNSFFSTVATPCSSLGVTLGLNASFIQPDKTVQNLPLFIIPRLFRTSAIGSRLDIMKRKILKKGKIPKK
ncbi:hypothetical protein RRG08_026156 [Elysia crispata]|uniref:Uncharacterized protein n=1 Tax=Elysia crispata TaxID=231223 RepID=A0AAE0ZAE8_9GAST|nr:hypothetical protein RRG08_026156 [Elysia crispata]